ncbi:hypothetical protein A2630_02715 [Candidatus Woesebacteria bacterium RIFCSPHIGHO2_01_FULL_44_10]|uniref:Uncharacterized protein n=1 Tax=Candidatus Woesebacteria bacterium RIFCSPLOWO2_01_FULL_44_14 TaxID=1802525 RepID=A0A1F8C5L2_9BACT|nr:MAG: hypothetical protein A2630_02715 [Candidatus Woesebacteria bacterium RIFCSPHIGHO2_01_FULL_44_10]OGM70955.1 MAG: hypothetical protein A2975_01630 [Candidatus Woesebacteria bacterium RIFCSPLOWO2_01_FULL_44_14]
MLIRQILSKKISEKTTIIFIKTETMHQARIRAKKRDGADFDAQKFMLRLKEDREVLKKFKTNFDYLILNKKGKLKSVVSTIFNLTFLQPGS